jgi:hypothetical protein
MAYPIRFVCRHRCSRTLVRLKHHGLCELFKPKQAKCVLTVFIEHAKIVRFMQILHDVLVMSAISRPRHRER